jgi:hypothetical protein
LYTSAISVLILPQQEGTPNFWQDKKNHSYENILLF